MSFGFEMRGKCIDGIITYSKKFSSIILKEQTSKEIDVPGKLGGYCKVTGIEHIYPRTKPPILEVGFSRQGDLCEHFLFGNRKTEHRWKRTEMTDDSRRCFVVVPFTDSMAAGQSCTRLSCKQTARNNRHLLSRSLSLSPAVISRCRSWVMLLLVYVGPRATHFTGYCCWLTKVCGASGNTLYWVLLLVYVGWGLGQHTLLGIVVGLCGA
jgi:hypothetical protein